VLLPVGQKAPIPHSKGHDAVAGGEDVDRKEREYSVVSMTPRHDK
jgi:hypothetical protein